MYHCHSDYSLLDSCTKYGEYVELAVRDGARALSVSEHGKPLNWTEKWAACKKAGIRYIHSVEIYLTETLSEKVRDNYHTVLMARNMDGVKELNALISKSCDPDHFYYTNRISFDEFLGMSDNIVSTSACLASPLNKLPDTHPRYLELARKYDFLEVQPHIHPDQVAFNRRLADLAIKLGKPLIAGTDTHSSSQYKAQCRSILLAAKHKSYGDEDLFDLSYKTYDELVEMFSAQGALTEEEYMSAIENTNLLYDMTEDIELDTSIKYPILYGSREEDSRMFVETVHRKFNEKLESGIIPKEQEAAFREAISEEMRVFQKLQMDGFMLSMSELISWCKEQGMAIGTARGSVGGSRVAYITDIIDLNPEVWHTVFSRFCNEDRKEIGDIDIDCVESDRPAIFRYITERFGRDRTARVASFGTMQAKGVIDDVGRALAQKWDEGHPGGKDNPWSLRRVAEIKAEFEADEDGTKRKYPELFYYFDGLFDTKTSQSVHPAGMVISPITLADNFGVFDKDNESCLMLDMENIHDYTGLAKYDFLILKTVQVIRDTCRYLDRPYPKTYEIDWDDQNVWEDMIKDPSGIFQFESPFAFDSLRKFRPRSIFDMSLVTACIRPSGTSYRNELLSRKMHKNPSDIIDSLLRDNLGYLIYQEDTIKFLQEICGLSGSEADNIRRAIGRKQRDRLEAALPSILEGYCSKSTQPREVAEQEAKEFLQIIEDSASYQFGYNHSVAYCLLGYLCAYYRYYHPIEFITAFLNNAANDSDILSGTVYAGKVGIRVTTPKWGISRDKYFFDAETGTIAKDVTSIKYMSAKLASQMYDLAHRKHYTYFVDLLSDLFAETCIDTRQLDMLIKIDFFSSFGNQRELLRITDFYLNIYKKGTVKQIRKDLIAGSPIDDIVSRFSVGVTKSGCNAKSYTILDVNAIMHETEDAVRSVHMDDLSDVIKARNFEELMGYAGYVSGKEEDRRKLQVTDVFAVKNKKSMSVIFYRIRTKSIGSGKDAAFSIKKTVFAKEPVSKGDIIYCDEFSRDYRGFFTLNSYHHIV